MRCWIISGSNLIQEDSSVLDDLQEKANAGPMEKMRGAFSREDLLEKKLISKARS